MSGSRLALIVATDEYLDPSLRGLTSPMSDAAALAEALADPDLGEFEVEILRNRESGDIGTHLEKLLTERSSEDAVLIHFSCHGLKDDSGELYLAARNTLPTLLWSTAVDAAFVNRLIRRSRAGQVVLFLDCCYGGAFERGMVPRASREVDIEAQFSQPDVGHGRGRAVITASSAMEYAFEGSALLESAGPRPSIFTGALAEGLTTGMADRDQDGRVCLGELYDYIFDRVRAENPKQTPGKWEYGTQGDFVIARNPNRHLEAATLPEELPELMVHPFTATRLGAVQELLRLASGSNLPLAATAREGLLQMVEDDSRQVGVAVADALEQTALHVSPGEIDFGSVAVGDTPSPVALELSGVPLVEATTARTVGDGIGVRRAAREVRVTLHTTEASTVAAQVVLDGPAGNAVIRVSGVVAGPEVVSGRARKARSAKRRDHLVESAPGPQVETSTRDTPDQRDATLKPEPEPEPEPEPAPAPAARPAGKSDSSEAVSPGRGRLPSVTILLGAFGYAVALFLPLWSAGDYMFRPTDPENLLSLWILPLVPLAVGGVLVAFENRSGLAVGVTAGAAIFLWAQFFWELFDPVAERMESGFWLATVAKVVLTFGVVLAVKDELKAASPLEVRRDGRAKAGVALVAAAVVLGVLVGSGLNMTVSVWLKLIVTLIIVATFYAALAVARLPDRQRLMALAAATVLSLLQIFTGLELLVADVSADESGFQASLWLDSTVTILALAGVWVSQGRSRDPSPESVRQPG